MKLYSTREAAERLGLSETRLRRVASRYAQKVGRDWLWDDEAIQAVESRKGMRGHKLSGKSKDPA